MILLVFHDINKRTIETFIWLCKNVNVMYKKILLFLFLITAFTKLTFAASGPVKCLYSDTTTMEFSEAQPEMSIVKTMTASPILAFPNTLSMIASGNDAAGSEKCLINQLNDQTNGKISAGEGCELTDEEKARCARGGLTRGTQAYSGNDSFRRNGNLLGMVNILQESLNDPLPVNLAYYFNKNAQKIPFIKDTAYAATTGTVYGGPFLDLIYNYWTLSRNIAYAAMALALMVTGIMIIMGKNLDPKAGITVQQALPQIVIALVLITFSYPIGAAGASLGYNLRGSMPAIAERFFTQANSNINFTSVAAINFWNVLIGAGTGAFAEIISFVSLIIAAVMGLIVLLKIFGVYAKMLMAIITAPLVFTMGALPGNQTTTTNWFRQFGAYIVSLPAMSLGAWMVYQLIMDISTQPYAAYGGWGFENYALLVISPVVTFFGYSLVLGIPEKIDAAFGVGAKKK